MNDLTDRVMSKMDRQLDQKLSSRLSSFEDQVKAFLRAELPQLVQARSSSIVSPLTATTGSQSTNPTTETPPHATTQAPTTSDTPAGGDIAGEGT